MLQKTTRRIVAVTMSLAMAAFVRNGMEDRSDSVKVLNGIYRGSLEACNMICVDTFTNNPTNALLCQSNCLKSEELFPGPGCVSVKINGSGEILTGSTVEFGSLDDVINELGKMTNQTIAQ